jgi:hypothetical protein
MTTSTESYLPAMPQRWAVDFASLSKSLAHISTALYLVRQATSGTVAAESSENVLVNITQEPSLLEATDMVLMPDLFVSWASQPPMVNPYYEEVKPQAEDAFKT